MMLFKAIYTDFEGHQYEKPIIIKDEDAEVIGHFFDRLYNTVDHPIKHIDSFSMEDMGDD